MVFFYVLVLNCVFHAVISFNPKDRLTHDLANLTEDEIMEIATTNEDYFKKVLKNILKPRVVDTPGHEEVNKFITSELKSLGWKVEHHTFKELTPFGILRFTNIIASISNASRQLILACHYDSKYFKHLEFLGATDSAVPCSMLIHLAFIITPYIEKTKIGLTLIFFDGEEALKKWSSTDSIYGAKALAKRWENTFPKGSKTNYLHRIDLFILLDLIGVKNSKFYNFFENTWKWHSHLTKIEKKLKSMQSVNVKKVFMEKSTNDYVQDDHIPFLERNVPVLHLIPTPFPSEWHTKRDDYGSLDFPTIDFFNKILQVFVYSYLKN